MASAALNTGTQAAVFVVGDPGQGKTTLVDGLARLHATTMLPIPIHGSSSLRKLPYGVLAPYLVNLPPEDTTGPVTVLRSIWQSFNALNTKPERELLLVVDNAHDLDDPSAQIILELVTAGWAKLVVGARTHPGLPRPLLQLWYEGLAVRIDLPPLTLVEGLELIERDLGGDIHFDSGRVMWAESEGNPLQLRCLVDVARGERTLVQTSTGTWVLVGPVNNPGDHLMDVVRNVLQRRSEAERDALNLIALAEPAPRTMIEAVVGADVVQSLLNSDLIVADDGPPTELRPRHPVYGEALRRLASGSKSLALRQSLMEKFDAEPQSVQGLIRMVSWSLDCELKVPDRQLLRVAFVASKLSDNVLAERAASLVVDPELQILARAVLARVHYNSGRHAEAAQLLEQDFEAGSTPESLTVGALLWAVTHAAMGQKSCQIAAGAGRLRRAGERLAQQKPQDAAAILSVTAERARLIELIALSVANDYTDRLRQLDAITARTADADPGFSPSKIFALALRSEILVMQGHPLRGLELAEEALNLLTEDDDELFFYSEFVLVRYLTAAIASAQWERASATIDAYSATSSKGVITFGGGLGAARGFILLRQGNYDQALKALLPALEMLAASDSQQVLPAATAIACFAAAASASPVAKALWAAFPQRMAPTYPQWHLTCYLAAAKEYLDKDGSGIAQLLDRARVAQEQGLRMVEILNLSLCIQLGHDDVAARLSDLSGTVEGPWLQGWCRFGAAIQAGDDAALLAVGKAFNAAGLGEAAQLAFARIRLTPNHRVQHHGITADHGRSLTAREQLMVRHAQAGLTDRQIAELLSVSVRTVEGHLYRSYAKLGISGREQLMTHED